jgi:hypothetical protein
MKRNQAEQQTEKLGNNGSDCDSGRCGLSGRQTRRSESRGTFSELTRKTLIQQYIA